VTHLRQIYEYLAAKLVKTKRSHWVEEELQILTTPETYITDPKSAWERVKTRSQSPRLLAIVRNLAEFREDYAQKRDIPRSRVFKDDALIELASTKPQSIEDLQKSRLLLREARKGDIANGILRCVKAGLDMPVEKLPEAENFDHKQIVNPALADLLRVLLKAKTENLGVAAKLIAGSADLDALAAGDRDVATLHGWRYEVFGQDALRLCNGEIGLIARGKQVKTFSLS